MRGIEEQLSGLPGQAQCRPTRSRNRNIGLLVTSDAQAAYPGRKMREHHHDVGVIVARRKLKSVWADHAWLPYAVLPAVPVIEPWTSLGPDGEDELDRKSTRLNSSH